MAPALLTAVDSTDHVHLIIGSNSLASARCSKSVEVGAKTRLISPETASMHYGLVKRIDSGEVEWIKTNFQDHHLTTLGREEVNGVVDGVFVTLPSKDPLRKSICCFLRLLSLIRCRNPNIQRLSTITHSS
jgi:uroporphyrin-III C-methyltransferase